MYFTSKPYTIFITSLLIHQATLKHLYYELTASYFDGAPDGVTKKILGFNSQFPGPTLRASKGDWLSVKVTNNISPTETTTIHWHGIEQYLSPWYDGPRMLTQCDIPFNHSFTYTFHAAQSGTYWYHSHHTGQYAEGLWGALIIDNTPEVHVYDGEFILAITDWHHLSMETMRPWYISGSISKGEIPMTDSTLINNSGYYPCEYAVRKNMSCDPGNVGRHLLLEVERGKTYRFRIINPSTTVNTGFYIDGHKIEAIETDGVDTIRVAGSDRAYTSTGARASFLVKMDGTLDQYWIRGESTFISFKNVHENLNPFPNVHREHPFFLAVLKYKESQSTPESSRMGTLIRPTAVQGRPDHHQNLNNFQSTPPDQEMIDGFAYYPVDPVQLPLASPPYPETNMTTNPISFDQRRAVAYGHGTHPTHVNQTIVINLPDIDHSGNSNKPGFNNITYDISSLDKPALFKLMLNEELPASLQPIEINGFGSDYVVELILNDFGEGGHPIHLHGHTYWVMGFGPPYNGTFDEEKHRPLLTPGLRRETIAVARGTWLVVRFRADNPGIWLLHCHMNFHFEAAFGLVFVEGREQLKKLYDVPKQSVDLCRTAGVEIPGFNDMESAASSYGSMSECSFLVVMTFFYRWSQLVVC